MEGRDPVEAYELGGGNPRAAATDRTERHVAGIYKAGVALGIAAGRLLRRRRD